MRMFPHGAEIENIKNQIIAKYHPEKIILFGSCAKGRIKNLVILIYVSFLMLKIKENNAGYVTESKL